jgi:hypothetical protein
MADQQYPRSRHAVIVTHLKRMKWHNGHGFWELMTCYLAVLACTCVYKHVNNAHCGAFDLLKIKI